MRRGRLAILLLIAIPGLALASVPRGPAFLTFIDPEPEPRLAKPLDRWPNEQDLARLKSVEGKPRRVVLRLLGHPSAVERRADGEEVWDYPWCARCRVWIKGGVCTGTFYTAGY
jgi:hypothetical protein